MFVEPLENRRLLAHIGLDPGFGSQGIVAVNARAYLGDVAGGKILAIGPDQAKRLNDNGSPDSSFVDRGADTGNRAIDHAAISGNRLLLAGRFGTSMQFYVRAVNFSTGAVDTSFGNGGMLTFTPQAAVKGYDFKQAYLTSMTVTSDGGVVFAMSQYFERTKAPTVVYADLLYKLTPSGQFDNAFGTSGVMVINSGQSQLFANVVALPAGGFFLRGPTSLQRRNNNGGVDVSFGTNGSVAPAVASFPTLSGPFLAPDGKIVLAVTDNQDSTSFAYAVRYLPDGAPDTAFGDAGVAMLGQGSIQSAAVDSSGRVAGAVDDRLFRLDSGGQLDPSFDDDGFADASGITFNVDTDSAGRLLVAGEQDVSRFVPGKRVELGTDELLRIEGTDNSDTITASFDGMLNVSLNGQNSSFNPADVMGLVITGNGGDDTVNLPVEFDITVNGGEGNDSIVTSGGTDSLFGNAGNDTIDAGGGRDLVFGGEGNDSLYGNVGDDTLFGEQGDDSLSGGDGNDKLYGGLATGGGLPDGSDSLSGNAGLDRCDGQNGNDRVAGNGGRDRLFGGTGDDRIYGGASGDWLYGGLGKDQLFGEGGNDRLYADDAETDPADVDTLHGNGGDDLLISRDSTKDFLFGDGGTDTSYADVTDELISIATIT